MSKSWYRVQNKSDALDVSIHEEIGLWGITAQDFIADIRQFKGDVINLSINSPGGSVFDGFAMYNAIKDHPATVNAKVEGIAASAASTVLLAADNITMPEASFLMIHDPWSFSVGNSTELREMADFLDKLGEQITNIYVKNTTLERDEIIDMMANETWLNGQEALDMGFVDSLTEEKAAALNRGWAQKFKNAPKEKAKPLSDLESKKEFEQFLRESGGFSKSMATAITNKAGEIARSESVDLNAELEEIHSLLTQSKLGA